ncbi:hypothetical protein FHS78_003370 [Parvibaculum indicum]|uniref:DUF2066 domain-containing protein n=1 Tax=Parvibaculum indicum TaxID=562969 RepID=UPI001423040F|nr:DUF2066 domain-containing protein [Parvibaculum indicum]NIJ43060.1 hypothetical protein [Parvibaculum indicum]
MKAIYRLLPVAGLFLASQIVFGALPAGAGELFTVKNVHVDVTADSAATARGLAQAKGQREALTLLMQRLTLPEDWDKLPPVDDGMAQNAVSGFQVADEKASSTRYIADLIVSFQRGAVRGILGRSGVPYAETQARPALLLPVLEKDGTRILWEDDNPWRKAWNERDLAGAMKPLIVPLGDIDEMSLVPVDKAVSGDAEALKTLADRYGAADAVVALAKASPRDGKTVLDVTVTHYGDPASQEPIQRSFEDETLEGAAAQAAQGMLTSLGIQWKRQIIVRDTRIRELNATASFANLGEWQKIRQGLGSTPLITGMDVMGITGGAAELHLSFKGAPERLALSLAQQGIALSPDGAAIQGPSADGADTGMSPVAEPGDDASAETRVPEEGGFLTPEERQTRRRDPMDAMQGAAADMAEQTIESGRHWVLKVQP